MFWRGSNYKLRYSAGVIRENRGTLNGGDNSMRTILLITVAILGLSSACGGEPETEITADSTASIQTDTIQTDTTQVQEMQHTSPQDAITGAYNLIDEADSVVNQLNARTEELEEMMGDM
jgi:hypothetical protein